MADVLNKFLVFDLGGESYGIPLFHVREVMRFMEITPLHENNTYLKGVISLRGKVIPIIDLRAKFGMETLAYNDRTIFIIVDAVNQNNTFSFGVAVDRVQDVSDIPEDNIEKAASVGLKLKNGYLYGIARHQEHILMILDMGAILSADEIVDMQSVREKVA